MHLSAIASYPVKSCARIEHAEIDVGLLGLTGDRRWMVVDAQGRFVSGRKFPQLVRIAPSWQLGRLRLTAPGMAELLVDPQQVALRRAVEVWGDGVDAADAGEEAAAWISAYSGHPLRLVHFDAASRRQVDPAYAAPDDQVAFADGFPLLLLSQAAADRLSQRVGRPMSIWRFRPNLVIAGCAAHAEDRWRRIRIGSVEFELAKPCTRCVFTTVDPDNGDIDAAGEPLRSLREYRRGAGGIEFGQNLVVRAPGRLRLGDPLTVLEWRDRSTGNGDTAARSG